MLGQKILRQEGDNKYYKPPLEGKSEREEDIRKKKA